MKKTALAFLILLLFPGISNAEDFLGAPVVSQGKENVRTDARLEMKTPLSHDEVVLFYKEQLKDVPDIKFRDWKDSTYIEDDGARPWHSITISKDDKDGATIRHRQRQLDMDYRDPYFAVYRRICGFDDRFIGNGCFGKNHLLVCQASGGKKSGGIDRYLKTQ